MSDTGDEVVMLDPRRNQAAERKKLYEEMLLKEMPGNYTVPCCLGNYDLSR